MLPRDTAGGIVLGVDGKIVLVNQGNKVWSFPKGGIEEGESILEAAKREVKEECGVSDLQLVADLGSYMRRRIAKDGVSEDTEHPETTRSFFLFKTSQTELTPQAGEIVEVRWVTLDEALSLLTHPKDKAFLESVLSAIEEAIDKVK